MTKLETTCNDWGEIRDWRENTACKTTLVWLSLFRQQTSKHYRHLLIMLWALSGTEWTCGFGLVWFRIVQFHCYVGRFLFFVYLLACWTCSPGCQFFPSAHNPLILSQSWQHFLCFVNDSFHHHCLHPPPPPPHPNLFSWHRKATWCKKRKGSEECDHTTG